MAKSSLEKKHKSFLVVPHCTFKATGLEIEPNLPLREWRSIGELLKEIEGSVQWWIGDWLNYGKRTYGETYAEVATETGYQVETLRNAVWVAGKFETSSRDDVLTWGHHKAVASLSPVEQRIALHQAKSEGLNVRETERLARHWKSQQQIAGLPALDALGSFHAVMIDPPWDYDDQGSRIGATRHYPTMTLDEIAELPVDKISARNGCHLYLWTTNSFMKEAWGIAEQWGFEPKTVITWVKTAKSGKPQIGAGHYFRNATEHIIFAVRGQLATLHNDQPNVIYAPRGQHSEKPEAAYKLIEKMSPAPYCEVFARKKRRNWSTWGEGEAKHI